MRYRTIKDLDFAGLDLRVWCQGCGRTHEVDAIVWMTFDERGWSTDLVEARRRFRCSVCGNADHVVLIAATRPPAPAARTWHQEVEAFFHGNRKGKRLFAVPAKERPRRR